MADGDGAPRRRRSRVNVEMGIFLNDAGLLCSKPTNGIGKNEADSGRRLRCLAARRHKQRQAEGSGERGGPKMEPRRRPHPPGGPAGSAAGGPMAAAPGAASATGAQQTSGSRIENNLAPPRRQQPQQPPPPPGYASYAGGSSSSGNANATNSSGTTGTLPQAGDGPPDLVRESIESRYHKHHHAYEQQQPESPSKYSYVYGSHEDEEEESELSSSFEMDRMVRSQAREGVRGRYLNKGNGGMQQQQASSVAGATAVGGAGANNNPLSSPAASRRAPATHSAAVGPTPRAWGSDMNGGAGGVYGNSGRALTTPMVVRKPNADGSVGGGVTFAAPPQTAPRGGTATNKPPMYTPAGVALARNPHLNLNVTPNTAAAATSASGVAAAAASSSGGGADTSTGGDGSGRTRDAFSPATVQLARTLDNLMDDDDDDDNTDPDDDNDKDLAGTIRPGDGATIEPSPKRAVGTGSAIGGRGARGGGGSALDALAAAIHASPRRTAMLGDSSTIAATADLSLSSSSADPSPIRTVRGIGAAVGTGLEDWSSVYPYHQQQQNHSPQGRARQSGEMGGTQISFGAFSPPAKNQQPDQRAPQQDQAGSEGVGGGSVQQEHHRTRSSDSPDTEMTQLQHQFNRLGQQPNAAPPQQYPGPHRGWMGGQSPNIFSQSPVPPGTGMFGAAGATFMQDPRQVGMSPMNIPPLPSGIMVSCAPTATV